MRTSNTKKTLISLSVFASMANTKPKIQPNLYSRERKKKIEFFSSSRPWNNQKHMKRNNFAWNETTQKTINGRFNREEEEEEEQTIVKATEDPEGKAAPDARDSGGVPHQSSARLRIRPHQLAVRPPQCPPQRHHYPSPSLFVDTLGLCYHKRDARVLAKF